MANTNKQDYYDILGISKNASSEEIKSAYRKKAREHHPDMAAASDKAEAEKRFKEINEAYQMLSDPEKKRMYDQFGHTAGGSQGPGGYGGQPGGQWGPFTYKYANSSGAGFDPLDIFEEVFGFRGFGGGTRRPRKGKNLFYEMHVDFSEAVHGVEKAVQVESGKVTIKIPKGVRNGTEIRFEEKGMPGPNNLPPGDLYITVRVPLPNEFQRAGDHLAVIKEIDFTQAILGDSIEVPVIDMEKPSGLGKAKLKIPVGTQSATQFRLRGKGMPRLQSTGQGDIIVQVIVRIPKRVNRKQRKLLEEYQKNK